MEKFTAWDTIHGREGSVYITIEGRTEILGNVKVAKVEETQEIVDVPIMGERYMQHKPGGKTLEGELTLYYTSSILRDKLLEVRETKKPPKINLVINNDDPASTMGVQSITFTDLIFEGFTVAQVDVESEILEEELTFRAGGYTVTQKFQKRSCGGR